MISALNTAVAGLSAASDQFRQAADRVASTGTSTPTAGTAPSTTPGTGPGTTAAPAGAGATGRPIAPPDIALANPGPDAGPRADDLVRGLVSMTQAEASYRANIVTVRTADEMLAEAIDLVS